MRGGLPRCQPSVVRGRVGIQERAQARDDAIGHAVGYTVAGRTDAMAQVAQALGVQSQAEKQLLDVYAETDNDMRWLRASIEGLLIAAGIALPNAENGYSNLPYIMYWGETVHQGLMAGAGYRDTLVESVGPERAAELMKYLAI